MTVYYEGKCYGDDTYSAVEDAFSEEMFIDNFGEEIDICGLKYCDLDVLKKVDPIAFKCAYDDMCDSYAQDIESGETDGEWLGIHIVEDDE